MKFFSLALCALCFLSCNKNDSPNPPTTTTDSLKIGLIASYSFSANAKDESGNNYNLKNDNAVLSEDRFGNASSAYSFNGIDSKLIIPAIAKADSTFGFTISFWAKIDSTNYLLSFLPNPDNICDYSSNIGIGYDQTSYYSMFNILGRDFPTSRSLNQHSFNLNDFIGKWVHFVFVQRYQKAAANEPSYFYSNYINGVATSAYQNESVADNYDMPVSFGNGGALGCLAFMQFDKSISYEGFFKGSMDDVRFYNRALSVDDIQKLYKLEN